MKHKKRISILLILIISILLTASASAYSRQGQQFIRFHVIANSDSYEDQSLKLRVRDRLLAEYGVELGEAHSLEESRQRISEKIEEIELTAQEEVDRYLPGYTARAVLGYFDFPTKAYGALVLPAGNYEALRVVIGKGEGANWWCVMFPPLCFVDITHGVAESNETTKDDLGNGDDNATINKAEGDKSQGLGNNGENITRIEYKFKILEWWDMLKDLFCA